MGNESFAVGKKRTEYRGCRKDIESYQAGPEIDLTVGCADSSNLPRVAELVSKISRFNMTAVRYSKHELERMQSSENYRIFVCSARDKFGGSGMIGTSVVMIENDDALIESFLLSWHALGKHIEYAFLAAVIKALRQTGIKRIYSKYSRTEKNKSNAAFYKEAGFEKLYEEDVEIIFLFPAEAEPKNFDHIKTTI